jgi:hypothetical protein
MMDEFLTLDQHGVHCVIARHPVSRENYKRFLRETHMPVPPALAQPAAPGSAVTYVSQVEARAYCQWLGSHDSRRYRLPTMAELLELYSEDTTADGFSSDLWPHEPGDRPEIRGGMKQVFLCEWSDEIEEIPQPDQRRSRVLGSVFYPPWLREGANSIHAQAHLLATEGYSFITFRVAAAT